MGKSPGSRGDFARRPFLAGSRTVDTISIWDLATGIEVAKRAVSMQRRFLAFRPDGKAMASGHADGTALVWDLSGLPGVKPAATDRDAAWKDLASADAGKAYRAILALAADPSGVAFLREKVKPAPEIPSSRIQKLVKDLGDDEYATREAATDTLKKLGSCRCGTPNAHAGTFARTTATDLKSSSRD